MIAVEGRPSCRVNRGEISALKEQNPAAMQVETGLKGLGDLGRGDRCQNAVSCERVLFDCLA